MSKLTHKNLPVTTFEVVKGNVGPYLPGEQFARELTFEEAKRFLDAGIVRIAYQGEGADEEETSVDPLVVFNADALTQAAEAAPDEPAKSARSAKEGK